MHCMQHFMKIKLKKTPIKAIQNTYMHIKIQTYSNIAKHTIHTVHKFSDTLNYRPYNNDNILNTSGNISKNPKYIWDNLQVYMNSNLIIN